MLFGWSELRLSSPNQRMKPTLLSRVLVRVFSVLRRFDSSLVTLRQPQGGLCAIRSLPRERSEPRVSAHRKIDKSVPDREDKKRDGGDLRMMKEDTFLRYIRD
jgi:hypothetical protein